MWWLWSQVEEELRVLRDSKGDKKVGWAPDVIGEAWMDREKDGEVSRVRERECVRWRRIETRELWIFDAFVSYRRRNVLVCYIFLFCKLYIYSKNINVSTDKIYVLLLYFGRFLSRSIEYLLGLDRLTYIEFLCENVSFQHSFSEDVRRHTRESRQVRPPSLVCWGQ